MRLSNISEKAWKDFFAYRVNASEIAFWTHCTRWDNLASHIQLKPVKYYDYDNYYDDYDYSEALHALYNDKLPPFFKSLFNFSWTKFANGNKLW